MRVEFFNKFPEGTTFREDAFDDMIGKSVPLKRDGEIIGEAHIQSVWAEGNIVYVTYLTEADFGLEFDFKVRVDADG